MLHSKSLGPYFLARLSPYLALQTYSLLLQRIPPNSPNTFKFLGKWLSVACTHITAGAESILRSKWQNSPTQPRMISWMQCRTLYVNHMLGAAPGGTPGLVLDPQECFNKALETVAALRPISEVAATKKCTPGELRRLRAMCSLSIPEMEFALPSFHEQLRGRGPPRKGQKPYLPTNDPGLVYVPAKLVSNVKECKYGLSWDTLYRNCHQGNSTFAVPHMSMQDQQEPKKAYQKRLQQATTTTLGDIKKGKSSPSPAPQDYRGLPQLLSNYVRLLGVLVGTPSAHTQEVVAIPCKLHAKVDLYVEVGP
jgi:hypothetical protein